MQVQVSFFADFREIFQEKEKIIQLKEGATIGDLLHLICDSKRKKDAIFNNGAIKPFVAILINGKHVQYLNGLSTKLSDNDKISLFPPVGGG